MGVSGRGNLGRTKSYKNNINRVLRFVDVLEMSTAAEKAY